MLFCPPLTAELGLMLLFADYAQLIKTLCINEDEDKKERKKFPEKETQEEKGNS
jgi:hypothetical protein